MDKSVIISIKGTQTYEDAEPETIEPVSYTHLDVYKRQLWYRTI